jgi:A/G-specific adenine glycosylase
MSFDTKTLAAFKKTVFAYYNKEGRTHLPWRKTTNPYRILVSEVMLQQTQVDRVIPYYRQWLAQFPTVKTLADAPLSEVLAAWQGLGYNRRAKHLHAAAKAIATEGVFPKTPEALEKLPGIGPYTARAIAAFSSNQDVVFVETNLRTAVTHHFFPHKKQVDDKEVLAVLAAALPKGRAREWYAALMDYGAHLKRSGVRLNAKANAYRKQSTFRGSSREARGAILKALVRGPQSPAFLVGILGDDRVPQVQSQLAALTKEGLIVLSRGKFRLPV